MKRYLKMFVIFILIITLQLGCEANDGVKVSRIYQHQGWIYYTNINEGSLNKMKPDMSEKTMVSNIGDFMVFYENYIFFLDAEQGISRIQLDGSDYQKILDLGNENTFGFDVSNGWLYYVVKPGSIYKVKIDGTNKSKVADIKTFNGNMIVEQDWIYYVDDSNFYKMNSDGKNVTKLESNVNLFDINNGWIYYGSLSENEKDNYINKMTLEGLDKTKLTNGNFVSVDEKYLYFYNAGWLSKMSLDRSTLEKLNNKNLFTIGIIYSDYIFYIEYSGSAYRIDLDGNNQVRIE